MFALPAHHMEMNADMAMEAEPCGHHNHEAGCCPVADAGAMDCESESHNDSCCIMSVCHTLLLAVPAGKQPDLFTQEESSLASGLNSLLSFEFSSIWTPPKIQA